jgi:hypothetical protein
MNADRKGVALALVATFLILVSDEVLNKNRAPKPKRVVSFAIVFLILGFMVEIDPLAKTAKYFSVLLLIGTVYRVGPDLYTKAQASLNRKAPVVIRKVTPKKVSVKR